MCFVCSQILQQQQNIESHGGVGLLQLLQTFHVKLELQDSFSGAHLLDGGNAGHASVD